MVWALFLPLGTDCYTEPGEGRAWTGESSYIWKNIYFPLRTSHRLIKSRVSSSRAVIFFLSQKANVASFTAEGCLYFHIYCHFCLKWHFPILVQPVVPKYNLWFEHLEKSLDFLCMMINFLYTMRMKWKVTLTSSAYSLY